MSAESSLVVLNLSGQKVCEATVENGEVSFADPAIRWTWVLDARHEPYDALERDELLHRAEHARKEYVLIAEA